MIKTLFNYIVIEKAIDVLFDRLNTNLQTIDAKYTVGSKFTYLKKIYSNAAYGEETGVYYVRDVFTVTVMYKNLHIVTVDSGSITFKYDTKYITAICYDGAIFHKENTPYTGDLLFHKPTLEGWQLG
jgi:hypothetical protein